MIRVQQINAGRASSRVFTRGALQRHLIAMKRTHTGLGTFTLTRVGVSSPVD